MTNPLPLVDGLKSSKTFHFVNGLKYYKPQWCEHALNYNHIQRPFSLYSGETPSGHKFHIEDEMPSQLSHAGYNTCEIATYGSPSLSGSTLTV